MRWRQALLVVCAAIIVSGCATIARPLVNNEPIALRLSEAEVPEPQLLNVLIEVFDAGELPESEEEARGLTKSIREAEARYIPAHLKDTMQRTGFWGPVRVVPADTAGGEVRVTGRILKSDGEVLKLAIRAEDATGVLWFSKTYEAVIDSTAYDLAAGPDIDVFQNMYNGIANDLDQYRAEMLPSRAKTIRDVAEIRFAKEFAPEAFAGYLEKKQPDPGLLGKFSGLVTPASAAEYGSAEDEPQPYDTEKVTEGEPSLHYAIVRLPAEDDPMLARIRRIKIRDDMLIDTFDMQYERLYRDMNKVYAQWRESRMAETDMIRDSQARANEERTKGILKIVGTVALEVACVAITGRSCLTVGTATLATIAVSSGVRQIGEASNIEAEAELNRTALVELGQSFDADVKPIVLEVEGQNVELTGSAQAKFRQWRKVLRALHERTDSRYSPCTANAGGTAQDDKAKSPTATERNPCTENRS